MGGIVPSGWVIAGGFDKCRPCGGERPGDVRAAWCGHTVAVNVATYTHARPEDIGRAAEALGKIHNLV